VDALYRSGAYRASVPRLLRLFGPLHVGLYRLLRGHVVGRMSMGFMPLLLLTTVGRRSGRARTLPVGYLREGNGYLVVGSNGALPPDPAWTLNLRAHPEAVIELDGARLRVRAAILSGDERERAWRAVVTRYPFFRAYQSSIPREIPVVRLQPTAEAAK